VNAEEITEMKLVFTAISSNMLSRIKNRPSRTKNGVPGGWGLPRILAAAMNSPQSQKERVAAMVLKNIIKGIIRLKAASIMEIILRVPALLSVLEISHLLNQNS
jgi:hypothetical protein